MATRKSTQGAPESATENLLTEIAGVAYCTERRLRLTSTDDGEVCVHEVEVLREAISKMGWMADLALKNMGSDRTWGDGDPLAWLVSPDAYKAITGKVQS